MTRDVDSSDVTYSILDEPRSRTVPVLERLSLPHDGTISPSWLVDGLGAYQRVSPVPSISTEVWMGYSDEASALGFTSSASLREGNMSSAFVTFTESCLCGCNRGGCIPQREYERPRTDPVSEAELQEMILFSVNGECGYPLKDALKKQYTGLDGRDDKMFVTCKSSISIRLEWLPYEKWTRQIRTLTWRRDQDHITRAKLATEVAKRIDAFLKEMEGKDADPAYREYRVQPGTIDLNHLELVALKRVSKSSWMPHLRLIDPSRPLGYASPITSSNTQERARQVQTLSRGDVIERSKGHEWSSVPCLVHPVGGVAAEAHEQSPTPGPAHLAEEAIKGPIPVGPTVRNRDTTLMTSCICGCAGGACIPQRTDNPPRHVPQETILFNLNGKCGYPLVDALKERYTGLGGRDDTMFVDCKSYISLGFEWLPYEKWTGQVLTLTGGEEPGHINRAALATEVAKWTRAFFEEMKGKEADPSHLEYRVQPGVNDLDHLELVALEKVSGSSWTPQFRLIARSPRCPSPVTSSHTQERVDPLQQVQKTDRGDLMEGSTSEARGRSSIPGLVHPGEEVAAEAHEENPTPGPARPADETAKGPTPIDLTVRNRDTTVVDSCICGCAGGACIPQRTDTSPLHVPQETILFNTNGKCGYPLVDALQERYTGLGGRDDTMFVDCKSYISLGFEWLPYEKWMGQVLTLTGGDEPGHISRAMLATEVAKWTRAFFEEMKGKEANPSYLEYRVQPGVIDLDHLELVALERITDSSWMPHFRLITPSQ